MTLFGLLWAVIICYCFIKKRIEYMLGATLLFMTFQSSNVIVLSGAGIGPGILSSVLLIIKVFIYKSFKIKKIRNEKVVFLAGAILFSVVFVSTGLNHEIGKTGLLLLQLLVYILCFTSIQFLGNVTSEIAIYNIIRKIIIFHCIFAVVQILTTVGILPIRSLLDLFIYNDSSSNIVFHKAYYARMMSTFMEPSYFAGFVVGAFYLLLNNRSQWHKNRWIILVLGIEIIMTQSSTTYGAFFVIGILFILCSSHMDLKHKIIIIGIAAFSFAILFLGFHTLLEKVIFSKNETASYSVRLMFDNRALTAFYSSPLYGVGYKSCRGSSIITSLLGQIGIVGFGVYLLFNLLICTPLLGWTRKRKTESILLSSVRFAVMSAVTCQIISCPDLDLCTYWFWLYMFSIVVTSEKNIIRGT